METGTELNANLIDIFREIKAANMVHESELPKRLPRGVDTNKWCKYHRTVGHDTDDCFTLKREIEKLIKAGHLQRYVQINDRLQALERDRKKETLVARSHGAEATFGQELGPPTGTINTISEGYREGCETHAAQKKNVHAINSIHEVPWGFYHPGITITKADFFRFKPHKDDPILVQQGSVVSILDEYFWIREVQLTSFVEMRLIRLG